MTWTYIREKKRWKITVDLLATNNYFKKKKPLDEEGPYWTRIRKNRIESKKKNTKKQIKQTSR